MTGTEIFGLVAVTLATGLLARRAYRRGRAREEAALPPSIVAELRTHKLTCLGESPERVALELSLLPGAGAEAAVRPDESQTAAPTGRGTNARPG